MTSANWFKTFVSFILTCKGLDSCILLYNCRFLGDEEELWSHEGGGSGGYLHHIARFAVKSLFGHDLKNLEYKTLR